MRSTTAPTPNAATALATTISIVFSPFAYLTLYMIAIVARGGAVTVVPALVLWAGLGVLPALGILVAVRRGIWSDIELSRLSERRMLLPIACAVYALVTWLADVMHMPTALRFMALSFLIAALLAMAVTLSWKISLHTCAGGSVLGLSLLQLGVDSAVAAAIVAVALCWSRLRLGRHDFWQVVAGTALGLGVALVLAAVHPGGPAALRLP